MHGHAVGQGQAGGQGEELKAGVALFEKRLRRLKGVMASRFGLDPERLQHVCQEEDAPVPKPVPPAQSLSNRLHRSQFCSITHNHSQSH